MILTPGTIIKLEHFQIICTKLDILRKYKYYNKTSDNNG